MGSVRRWAGLVVAALALVGAAAAFTLTAGATAPSTVRSAADVAPAASAGSDAPVLSARSATLVTPATSAASVTPVPMNYACTSKITGLMRYVSSPTQCAAGEKAVTIDPGPVYVCVYFNLLVRQVAALSDCRPPSAFVKALTLPASSGPVYFCAAKTGGYLTYTTSPSGCTRGQFPVVVPVLHTPPVLANIESSTLQYYAGTPPVAITSSLTVSSADATTLAGATVTISSGFVSSDDSLAFTNANGITGSYDSSTGVLTLTGTASLADYQAALRSVTYQDSDALTAPGSRTISFQVNDGFAYNNLSNVVSRTVSVLPNIPPTCTNVTASTDKNTAIAITVLSGCSDVAGDTVTLTSVNTTGTLGSVSINANGTIEYNPNGQFQSLTQGQTATDTFTFVATNGFQDSSPANVTVTITGVNDAPVLANIETSPLSYQAQTAPAAITSALTISDDDDAMIGGATVAITSGFDSGADTLSFTNQNGITGSYDSSTGVLTLSGAASLADYQAALRSVEFSTSDSSASPAARTISFQVTDSLGATSNTATRTIDVSEAAQPPLLNNIETTPLSYQAQSGPSQITATLTVSDPGDSTIAGATVSITSGFDSGADTLSFTNQNGITGSYDSGTGILTLSGDAFISSYQTALRSIVFSTTDDSASPLARVISFQVTDSLSHTSNTATRTIDVSEAAMPPTAVNQSYTAVGNTPLGVGTSPSAPAATVSGSLLNGDSDPSDPSATLSVTANSSPGNGSVVVNPDGTFTYTPVAGFSGTDSFTYTIAGSNAPSQTATATVTITVGPVVWYVNNSLSAAGTGQSTSPFNTLAAANSAAGKDSIIFLYQGSATYTGGVTLLSGEDLWGQPYGLTLDGYSLVAAGGSDPAITNSGGAGITLGDNSDVEAVSVSDPSGNGITASSVDAATVGTTDAVAISGAGGDGIDISGGSGTLNLAGASVTGSTGHSVSVSGRTGGTVTIGGNITDNTSGISLSSNTGATISFNGTLTISTGANTAFSATGGGTVAATGTGSTITTTTATALSVQNTTIDSGGLTFQSISSNGANPGIELSSTGTSGGLTVTGTGSAGSGGTIQASAGEGISLSSTDSPSFTDMVIKNNAADGINGTQVTGFTLDDSTVSGNGTASSVSGENDDGLDFSPNGDGSPDGLTGTVTISSSVITGSADNNAIISDTSGTLNLTVTGSTFSDDNSTTGNDGLHIDADGSTDATVSVTGSTFTNNYGDHFQFSTDSSSSGTNSVTFSNNTLNTTVSGVLGGGVTISPYGNSQTTLTVDGNNIQNSVFSGIVIDEDGTTGTLSGTVHGNTIGTATTANSGSQGNDIGIFAEGSVTETLAITGNTLYQYDNEAGISFLDREGNPAMNLTITGNTIADPGTFGSWGLLGQAGAETGDNGTVCAAISGNSMTGSAQAGQGGADFEVDQEFNSTVELPGYSGGSQNTNAVVSFIQGNNISGGTPSGIATTSGTGGGFTDAASCPAP